MQISATAERPLTDVCSNSVQNISMPLGTRTTALGEYQTTIYVMYYVLRKL